MRSTVCVKTFAAQPLRRVERSLVYTEIKVYRALQNFEEQLPLLNVCRFLEVKAPEDPILCLCRMAVHKDHTQAAERQVSSPMARSNSAVLHLVSRCPFAVGEDSGLLVLK